MSTHATQQVLVSLAKDRERYRRFLARRLRNGHDVDEVLQTAFSKAADALHTQNAPENAHAWFFRIVRNTLIDLFALRDRERARASTIVVDEISAPEKKDAENICGCALGLLDALPVQYAEALREVDLKDDEDKPSHQSGAERVRLSRARAALRKKVIACCNAGQHACYATTGCRDCNCQAAKAGTGLARN